MGRNKKYKEKIMFGTHPCGVCGKRIRKELLYTYNGCPVCNRCNYGLLQKKVFNHQTRSWKAPGLVVEKKQVTVSKKRLYSKLDKEELKKTNSYIYRKLGSSDLILDFVD